MNESEFQALENPPVYAQGVAALASWSGNYDYPTPYTLFCDLIGFNGEEYGECYFLPSVPGPYSPPAKAERFEVDAHMGHDFARVHASLIDARLGIMELGMLADALAEYAERPADVTAYVRRILEAEREDES